MRIVFVHERYQQAGGEDPIFAAESELMETFGHSVMRYTDDNARVADMKPWTAAATTLWSRRAHDELRAMFRSFRPDVVHFHNTFPLISPSGYYAARAEGVPVVQTIHNYRLICPSATLFRDGRPCVDCVGRWVPWPAVEHACYRDSRPASLVVAGMLSTHRLLQTWNRLVHVYIAPSEFARQQLISGGLRGDRIVIKPNFINPDPGVGSHDGGFALFTGRLTLEKGLPTLLSAWERLDGAFPLKIVGDGPLADEVATAADRIPGVEWLGRRPKDDVVRLMQEASFLVVPSIWYEGFPMVIAEAFATGLPVMASDLGLGEIVGSSAGGVVFEADAPDALASKVDWARSHPAEILGLGKAARLEYEQRYTLERSYRMHLEMYDRAPRHQVAFGPSPRAASRLMRVGVDTNGLRTTQAGVARYIRGLLSGLEALEVSDLEVVPLAWEVDNLTYRQPQRSIKTLYREGVWAPWIAPRRMLASELDVFHATAGPMARIPVGIRKVATAHDMAIFRYPDRYRAWQRRSGPRRLAGLSAYDRVICISQFTADEAIRCLDLPASVIEVVHNGCDFSPDVIPPERPPDFELADDFYLFVGSLEPVKNLRLLREVYEVASGRGITLPTLVIVGARWLGVEGEGPPPRGWLYAGRQDDEVLIHLYRRALALVFPTRYEGFGFPLVEAMALGCPVICSPLASLPELGGDAPIYADQTPAAYLDAMLAVANDPTRRDDRIAAGRERARRFSWQRCAEETLAVYRDVI